MSMILMKKMFKNGDIFPNRLAESFLNYHTPLNTVKLLAKEGVDIDRDYIKDIEKEVRKNKPKKPNTTLRDRLKLALTSAISFKIVSNIPLKNKDGERQKAIWLPSGSSNPSLEHMRNYGEEFYLDEGINGELPSQRPNCQCGIRLI